MALYPRLIGLVNPRISAHAFHAALGEVERGKLTAQQAATSLGLDAGELAEATTLANRLIAPPEAYALGGFQTLTNVGATYDAITASLGLGFLTLQVAGITAVDFTVKVNKIGTGTQSWQLWNETDGSQITVLDDAGAAGAKTLTTSFTFGAPLAANVKVIRVRAKSTVAADDPLYFGASLMVRRAERLTADELHQVLLLAENARLTPRLYGTEVELKARLGVP